MGEGRGDCTVSSQVTSSIGAGASSEMTCSETDLPTGRWIGREVPAACLQCNNGDTG